MALLHGSGAANEIGVADVVSSSAWYVENLGLRKVKVGLDKARTASHWASTRMTAQFALGPRSGCAGELSPRLYCSSAKKAREFLAFRAGNGR